MSDAEIWIVEHFVLWQKICKVRGQFFEGIEEVIDMHETLIELARKHNGFEIIYTLFLTEYEKELPFLSNAKPEEE